MRSFGVAVLGLAVVGCGNGAGSPPGPTKDPVAARKATGAEVESMFAELRIREEQYRLEVGTYLSTGADETDTWPVKPSRTPRSIEPLPDAWTHLRVKPPADTLACAYVVIAGLAGDLPIGPRARELGVVAQPATWFYMLARCDHDGDPARDTYHLTTSADPMVRTLDEGR